MTAVEVRELDAEQRVAMQELAQTLLPGDATFPPAASLELSGRWLDRALKARPDLAGAVDVATWLIAERGLVGALEVDCAAVETLEQVAISVYHMHPKVRKAVGYRGQKPDPIAPGEAEHYLGDLLDPVRARGPRWRDPRTADGRPGDA